MLPKLCAVNAENAIKTNKQMKHLKYDEKALKTGEKNADIVLKGLLQSWRHFDLKKQI